MGSNTSDPNKRFRILSVDRWMAQGTGRKGSEKENNQRSTTSGRRRVEHGKSKQDPTGHRQRVWFQTRL